MLIALATAFACGGLVLGIAGGTDSEDDGMRVVVGWLSAASGAWLVVKLWRAPVGGPPARHSSGHDPLRREYRTLAILALFLIGGVVGIAAALAQRDLVMLGWSLLVGSLGGTAFAMLSEGG